MLRIAIIPNLPLVSIAKEMVWITWVREIQVHLTLKKEKDIQTVHILVIDAVKCKYSVDDSFVEMNFQILILNVFTLKNRSFRIPGKRMFRKQNRLTHFYSVYSCNSPQSAITTLLLIKGLNKMYLVGIPLLDPQDSIKETTSIPSRTRPKTTCFPSNHGVFTYNEDKSN